jgi:predicted P-loop ATPase
MADRIFDGDAELHGEAQRERAIFTNEKHVSDAWRQKLILTERHTPRGILANAITALREAPAWQSTIRFNDFTERAVIRGCPPWEAKRIEHDWTTADDIRTAEWLQHVGITVSPDTAAQAVEVVSRERRFHPVRDYLEQLCWDGIPRLDCWMIAFLSAEDTPYVRAISSRFSISAVARIYQPGCKADAVLILEGHQGTFKSTAIATLAEPWYTDEIDALGTKDASLQLAGVWLIELDELASMTRGEVDKVKAFISRRTDRFRPPYGRRIIERPRQCVFAGTINPSGAGYLRDETGARRFWPVRCGQVDTERLAIARDQIWAEARERYLAGAPWWLDTSELNNHAEAEQDQRYQADAWQQLIEDFCAARDVVSVAKVLKGALFLTIDRWGQAEQNRVARCLRKMGWERHQVRDGHRRSWRYRRMSPESPLGE